MCQKSLKSEIWCFSIRSQVLKWFFIMMCKIITVSLGVFCLHPALWLHKKTQNKVQTPAAVTGILPPPAPLTSALCSAQPAHTFTLCCAAICCCWRWTARDICEKTPSPSLAEKLRRKATRCTCKTCRACFWNTMYRDVSWICWTGVFCICKTKCI